MLNIYFVTYMGYHFNYHCYVLSTLFDVSLSLEKHSNITPVFTGHIIFYINLECYYECILSTGNVMSIASKSLYFRIKF